MQLQHHACDAEDFVNEMNGDGVAFGLCLHRVHASYDDLQTYISPHGDFFMKN